MKVALVHDMLIQLGGAENVLATLTEIFPQAPIFTLIYSPEKTKGKFSQNEIRASFLQKMPLATKKFPWYLLFMPAATESHDLSDFDLIISTSSMFAKGVVTPPNARHICYCHTPTRYLWANSIGYVSSLPYPRWLKSLIRANLKKIRMWDFMAAQRPDQFIANSRNTQQKIKKYYRRSSQVIYPPIQTKDFYFRKSKDFFLTGGRLVPYKKFDLTIRVFNKLGWPLKIFGQGPEEKRLKKIAKKNIEFLGYISEKEKRELYATAQAFLNPQDEDCGITILEALASGLPVIAFQSGGALEFIKEGENGLFFPQQTEEAYLAVLQKFPHYSWEKGKIKKSAAPFDIKIFQEKIKSIIQENN